MSGKHTPSAEQLQEAYEYWASGCGGSDGGEVERFLAAHDKALREQIDRRLDYVETSLLHVADFDKHRDAIQGQVNGIRVARRIVRGEADQ